MMRETLPYKAYLKYYRLKTRVKCVFNVITTIIGYIILIIIHFFLIGCFLGLGGAIGFHLVKRWILL